MRHGPANANTRVRGEVPRGPRYVEWVCWKGPPEDLLERGNTGNTVPTLDLSKPTGGDGVLRYAYAAVRMD